MTPSGSPARPVVCYVAAAGRSGTTLVGRLLGQVPGVVDVGELAGLWRVRARPGWRCGCGEPLLACPLWRAVLAQPDGAAGTLGEVDDATVAALRRRAWRTRHVPRLWWAAAVRGRPAVPAHARTLGALYAAVASATGASVIVDASKFPGEAMVAAGAGVDLRVLHLVRDPRAVAFSWSRDRPAPGGTGDGRRMRRLPPATSSALWAATNAATALFVRRAAGPGRYLRVRYEDLVADPRAACEAILGFLGVGAGAADLPFTGPHQAVLAATHSVTGNPGRFGTGPTTIALDDQWRRDMPRADRAVAAAVAAPVAVFMGEACGPWGRRAPGWAVPARRPGP